MNRLIVLLFFQALYLLAIPDACAQGSFADAVDRALGSNQELVSGIQFSNQYIRSEGDPYWLDGSFRSGALCINDQWFDRVQIRYNLYSQRLELEYYTTEGNLNQIMTVPENITAFDLEGYSFRRVQIGEEAPAYYQFVTGDGINCYIRWSKDLLGSRSAGTRFAPVERVYWMQDGERWMNFRNRKSYLAAFPKHRKKEFSKLLKQQDYNFQRATGREMVEMLNASIRLLQEGREP